MLNGIHHTTQILLLRMRITFFISEYDSVYSGLNNEQVHHSLLEVPALPGGAQDEDGHGDDNSVAVLAGKLLERNRLG